MVGRVVASSGPPQARLLIANRRRLSLVDRTNFETMRRLGLTCVFVSDPRFAEQGFQVSPG